MLVDDDAADVPAIHQVVIALVDLIERIGTGNELVELEVAGLVEAEDLRDVRRRVAVTEQAALHRLPEEGQDRAGKLDRWLGHAAQAGDHRDAVLARHIEGSLDDVLVHDADSDDRGVRTLPAGESRHREQGLAGASKRSDRERAEGAISVVVTGEGRLGAIVALECETDFVAKSADFVRLVDALADGYAREGEPALEAAGAEIDALKVTLKENIAVGRRVRFESEEGAVLDSYLHVQNGRGVKGVLIELQGGTAELAHDIAVHIAFARPEYLSRDEVPADAVAAERATVEAIARNEGKPEAQLEKIIEGRMNGWFKERVLLEQPFAKDEKRTITSVLGAAKIRRFAQVVIGA